MQPLKDPHAAVDGPTHIGSIKWTQKVKKKKSTWSWERIAVLGRIGENKGGDEGEKSEWDGVGLMIYIVKT